MIGVMSDYASTVTQWRTWWLMANQDISMRYRRSVLGPFWISISMAAMILGIAFLYGQIFTQEFKSYLLYVAPSMLLWTYIATLVTEGCNVAIDAEMHLRSVRVPLPVLAARMTHRNVLILLHNAIAVIALLLIAQAPLGQANIPAILAGVAVITLTGFFLSLILAPMCLRFRDIQQVIASAMQLLFFLTPVLWQSSQGRVADWIVQINPFYHFLELVRAPVIGASPTLLNFAVCGAVLAFCLVAATISVAISRRKLFLWM